MQFERVEQAISAIRNGEMIIIMDDEGRENEGDIVYAGEFSSPQKVNFLVTEARGVLCVSLTNEIAKKLDFPLMVDKNSSNHETAFTVSVDAKRAKTGVSAFERDMTIKLICNDSSLPSDFVKPGHIFPLIAKNGGVLVRTGHTEASVDICALAGVKPVAVICELLKKDGTMARNNDSFVLDFAKMHGLKILYVSDLVHYKFQYEVLVQKVGERDARFFGVECKRIDFVDHLESAHIVYKFGVNSTLDSANSQNLNKKELCEAPENSPASWCKKSESKGAEVPPADFLLEAEKRGSPPKSEKRQLLARRGSEVGGAALLREEKNSNESAESARNLQSGLPRKQSSLAMTKNKNFVESTLDSAVNVKFHTFNNTLKLLEGSEFDTLNRSVVFLRENGGFLVCLNNVNNEMSAENASESGKVVGIGAQILKGLKISEFNLLSTRKNHQYIALSGFGLKIKDEILI